MSTYYIAHHGVKGMRWGVRKKQDRLTAYRDRRIRKNDKEIKKRMKWAKKYSQRDPDQYTEYKTYGMTNADAAARCAKEAKRYLRNNKALMNMKISNNTKKSDIKLISKYGTKNLTEQQRKDDRNEKIAKAFVGAYFGGVGGTIAVATVISLVK